MLVNFMHNYSKTFFKGSPPSSETEAVLDKPLTTKEFRDYARQQMLDNRAMIEALQAIALFLQVPGTPHASKGGSEEVTAKALNDPTLIEEVPGPKVETAGHGAYNGSGPNKISYKDMRESLTLNQGDIVKTIKDGNKTTYMMRDGSVVEVDEKAETTTFNYSKCSNRDKNAPIMEVIRNRCYDEKMLARHWKNGDYDILNDKGELIAAKRIKSDGCEITFRRDRHGNYYVDKEAFPPKPKGKNTQYPKRFAIRPDWVGFDRNGNLETISPDYSIYNHNYSYSYKHPKFNSWDEATNKIQSYSCPLSKIEFYPTGPIKSEHYSFELNGQNHSLEIKFNENGQVDDIIISDAAEKEASSQIKEELIKAGYKGYAEYVEDFKERAKIAYSVLKRSEEVTVKAQEDIVKTSKVGNTTTYTIRDGSVVTVNKETETTTIDYSNCPNRGENDPIKEIYKGRFVKTLAARYWKNGAYEYFDDYGKLIETKRIKNDSCEITFKDGHYGFTVIKETFPPKPEVENTPPTECFVIHPKNVEYDENDNLKTISPNYDRDYAYMRQKIDRLDEAINEIKNYECPLEKIEFYPTGKIKSEHYTFVLYDRSCFFEIKFNENGQVDNVIVTDAWSRVNKEDSSRIKKELIETGYKGYTEYASDLKERASIAYDVLIRSKETPQ